MVETSLDPNDPRKNKKRYMLIFKDEKLYREFLKLYDKEIEEGSLYPAEMAMVEFREIYIRTDEGWRAK